MRVYQSTPREWYSYYEQFLRLNSDQKERARVLIKAAECFGQLTLADINKANELLDEAETISQGDPRNLGAIEFRRGELCSNDGRTAEALAHSDKSIQYYEEAGDPLGALRSRYFKVTPLRQAYRFRESKALAEEVLPLVRDSGDYVLIADIELTYAGLNVRMGNIDLVRNLLAGAIRETDKLGLTWEWRYSLRWRAMAFELAGELESARADLINAFESAKKDEIPYHMTFCEIELGLCELELDMVASAEHHYNEAFKRTTTLDKYLRSLLSPDLSILSSELLATKGEAQQCDEVYNATIRSLNENRQLYELVNCRSRYGMNLSRRGFQEEAQTQFDEAMKVAVKIGCEKRVQLLAKRVGVAIYPDQWT